CCAFMRLPREAMAAPPRRCMNCSSVRRKLFWLRSAEMVLVAYLVPASALRPRLPTPLAAASRENSTFHASNPPELLPHFAAIAVPGIAIARQPAAIMIRNRFDIGAELP